MAIPLHRPDPPARPWGQSQPSNYEKILQQDNWVQEDDVLILEVGIG